MAEHFIFFSDIVAPFYH